MGQTTTRSPLVLVSGRVRTDFQISDDLAPRQDYLEIAHAVNGELLGYSNSIGTWNQWVRRLQKRLRLDLVESMSAASLASKHSVLLSLSERIAIPLAVMFQLSGKSVPHIVIGHKLSSGFKAQLFLKTQLHHTFAHLIVRCQAQADYAVNELKMPESRVHFIPGKVDERFYRPLDLDDGGYVLSVGQEQRDYRTLIQALSKTGLKLIIVASSPSSRSLIELDGAADSDVKVLSHVPYPELRALYAQARLVAVPMYEADYAAGVSSIVEAMAMAKPIVLTRTSGILDYIEDHETGVYVMSQNPDELRDTILSLWHNAQERNRLGTNARQAVEERMTLDSYVNRIAQIVHQTLAESQAQPA